MDIDVEPNLLIAAVVGAALVLGLIGVARRRGRGPRPQDKAEQLAEAGRVVLDIQHRALESFIHAGLKGAQLRNCLFRDTALIGYSVRRQSNGVEHQLLLTLEGSPNPKTERRQLGELASLAVFVTRLAKLEPAPLEVDPPKRQCAVKRVLTELETRELLRTPSLPAPPELHRLFSHSASQAKALYKR